MPSALFRPFSLKQLELKNRVVMSPMTRSQSPGGVPGAEVAAYYRRRAEHGVGLLITEGTVIDHPASANDARVPRFYGEDALAGWADVVRQVHDAGGRIMPQLWHVGALRRPGDGPDPSVGPVSPSGLQAPDKVIGLPMTERDIEDVIAAFARGAAHAQRLGFDGVELHGGHGFLIDEFFWAATNQRTDRYGGDLVQRTRFAVEAVKAIRRGVGPDFPILLRISQWKAQDYTARLAESPEQLEAFLRPLVDAGVDLFDCSTRRFWEPGFEGSPLTVAGWVKKLSGKPSMAVGSIGLDVDMFAGGGEEKDRPPTFIDAANASLDHLLEVLARDEFDLVAVGRALLVDPAWAEKIREGRMDELVPFTRSALNSLS